MIGPSELGIGSTQGTERRVEDSQMSALREILDTVIISDQRDCNNPF